MLRFPAYLLCALLCTGVTAHPEYFVDKHSAGQCNSLPDRAYKPHGDTQDDGDIQFELLLKGKPVLKYCPGQSYTVKVSLPLPRQGLMTSNLGSAHSDLKCTTSSRDKHSTCCNDKSGVRWVLREAGALEYERELITPCSKTDKGGKDDLVIAVATSARPHDNYHMAKVTFPRAADCGACAQSAPGESTEGDSEGEEHAGQHEHGHKEGHEGEEDDKEHDDHHDHGEEHEQHGHGHGHEGGEADGHMHGEEGGHDHHHGDERVAAIPQQHAHRPVAKGQLCKKNYAASLSSLGYTRIRSLSQGLLTLHWTYGDCVPHNPCTEGANWRGKGHQKGVHLLHVAAEAATAGYVAVAFGRAAGVMPNNDAVLGWASESGSSVEAYRISSYHVHADMAYAEEAGLVSYAGVMQTSDGRTMICFGRPLEVPAANYSSTLALDKSVALNWATSGHDKLGMHSHKGGLMLSLSDGAAVVVQPTGYVARRWHGALMLLAWLLMAPMGILAARHKWVFRESKVGQTQTWFVAHRAVQAAALLIQFGSGTYALVYFKTASSMGTTHKVFGIISLLVALVQASLAVLRPKPDSKLRPAWFTAHHVIGVLLLAWCWVTGIVGILLLHTVVGDALLAWFTPCVGVVVMLVVAELFLQQQATKHGVIGKAGSKLSNRRDVALPEFQRLRDTADDL